jgi:hypothetical protein
MNILSNVPRWYVYFMGKMANIVPARLKVNIRPIATPPPTLMVQG